MRFRELIRESRPLLDAVPPLAGADIRADVFGAGAGWMATVMQHLSPQQPVAKADPLIFRKYGAAKYGISLAVAAIPLLCTCSLAGGVAAVFCFYLAEIQGVFLFPLLLDGVPNPVRTGIRLVWQIGLFRVLSTVMPIGFFMLAGLLNPKNPLRNWYLGCCSILLWYQHEGRNRIQRQH